MNSGCYNSPLLKNFRLQKSSKGNRVRYDSLIWLSSSHVMLLSVGPPHTTFISAISLPLKFYSQGRCLNGQVLSNLHIVYLSHMRRIRNIFPQLRQMKDIMKILKNGGNVTLQATSPTRFRIWQGPLKHGVSFRNFKEWLTLVTIVTLKNT